MAAPSSTKVNSTFCSKLFNLLHKTSTQGKENTTVENIVLSRNDLTYVWDNFGSCLRISNGEKIQTLLCSNPPLFHIQTVICNSTDSHLALIGDKGIATVELPAKYGSDGLYQGGKDKILCRSVLLDERYFGSHRKESVLKAVWHPGSPNGSHLCVLCSDDVLRVYNIAKPDCTHQVLRLSAGTSKFSAALGETFTSMTFGEAESISSDQAHLTWPLYLLTGSGNVYEVQTTLYSARPLFIGEPLKMLPMAEDNYGSDACDILYLNSSPACLVISTVSGTLIHCVILSGSDFDQDEGAGDMDISTTLYVYDIVKLELLLNVPSSDDDYDAMGDEEYTSQLILASDPLMADRYHCMHSAGVHTISLPWLSSFQQFLDKGDDAMISDDKTQCQHVICTRPLADCKPCPVRGLAVIPANAATTTLICLLSDFSCMQVAIRNGSVKKTEPIVITALTGGQEKSLLTNRREFIKHIEDMLRQDATNPVIRTGKEQSLTPEQSYKILCRATKVFREEYLEKLELARGELDRRVNSLRMLKEQQLSEVQSLRDQKESLTDAARDLAEKYEDVCETNEGLINRMEAVMSRIQSSISDLSDAERNLSTELQTRQDEMDNLRMTLDQIKKKHDYQKEALRKKTLTAQTLSDTQLKRINTILSDESHQISELVHRLQGIMSASQ